MDLPFEHDAVPVASQVFESISNLGIADWCQGGIDPMVAVSRRRTFVPCSGPLRVRRARVNPTVPTALFGWVFVSAALFLIARPSLAVSMSIVGAYLLLPAVEFRIASGIPDWTKDASASIFTLICAATFAPRAITQYRFHPLDLLVLIGGLCWGLSSIFAGYGIKQAVPDWWGFLTLFGLPYFLGRWYITTPSAIRDLSIVIVGATMLYGGLMLMEMRTFPKMNLWVYGWQVQKGREVFRLGGYRPVVFLPNGLATSIWECMAMVVAWGLYHSRAVQRVLNVPIVFVAGGLTVLAALTRSGGAIGIGIVSLSALLAYRFLRVRWAATAVASTVAIYIATGIVGSSVPIRDYASRVAELVYPDRAFSLKVRFDNEALLADRAQQKPVFGWGGWGDWRAVDVDLVREVTGQSRGVVTDGFWIIVFGTRGIAGVIATFGIMIVPGLLAIGAVRRLRAPPKVLYPVVALALWSLGFAMDQLLNGFVSTSQAFVAGGLASIYVLASRLTQSNTGMAATSTRAGSFVQSQRSAGHASALPSHSAVVR